MFGIVLQLLLVAVLGVRAEPEPEAEPGYVQRYGQRVGRREKPAEETVSSTNEGFEPQHETQAETVQASYRLQEPSQEDRAVVRSRRTNRHKLRHEAEDQAESMTDSASSYNPMVFHSNQEQRRPSSLGLQYKNIRAKPVKMYTKSIRQGFRETSSPNLKQYKLIKNEDPPPPPAAQQQAVAQSGDHFAHSVHPSIMQKLLKQQPQTFDVTPEKEDYDQGAFSVAQDTSNEQGHFEVKKKPIYVPNRVSIQNPSSDSSFNVGYSIGFGGGFQRPKSGFVDPPINYRQGKGISYASSYQNTPVNVHFDGKNSVWKNMGSGVEMSFNVDSDTRTPTQYSFAEPNEAPEYSSNQGQSQPIYSKESFDQSFNNFAVPGRSTFDHNHALQQSNSFDFSNAIDPSTNSHVSAEPVSNYVSKQYPLTYSDYFPKQAYSSFAETFPKQAHTSYSETFPKSIYPSVVSTPQPEKEPIHQTFSHNDDERNKLEGFRYEPSGFERPGSHLSPMPVKVTNSLSIIPKAKAVDFSKNYPFKAGYNIKSFPGSSFNQIHEDLYGNSYGLPGIQVIPQIYNHGGRPSSPEGMVQAFLVPVNTHVPSYHHPIGMPVVGGGYPQLFGQHYSLLKMPHEMPPESSVKEDYETQDSDEEVPQENQQVPMNYPKPTPMKIGHHHFSPAKYQKQKGLESSLYHSSRSPPYSYRSEGPSEVSHTVKYKRLLTTEAPSFSSSAIKSHSTTSSTKHPSEFTVSTPSPFPGNSHHPRLYRNGSSMIIVKRA